jgi:hypothetical protein
VTATELLTRELLDREIMLTCLAEAADRGCDSDLGDGKPARRVLDVRCRASRTLRLSMRLSAETRVLLTARPAAPADRQLTPSRPLLNGVAMARLVLDVRRGELAALRFEAADLRADACALRAEARQIRLMRRGAR